MRLRSLSIGRRLGAGFSAVVLLLVAVAAVGGSRMLALRGLTNEMTGRQWSMAVAAADLSAAANASARAKMSLLVLTDSAPASPPSSCSSSPSRRWAGRACSRSAA